MKYCHQFYDYLYLDHYNGQIYLCPWMIPQETCIGNLNHDSIEDAYHSDFANHLRATMDDQTFRYCRMEACPHLQNNGLPDISEEEYARLEREGCTPKIINLACDFVCNQSCETCRKDVFVPPPDYAERLRAIRDKIAPYLDKAERITASGHGDPFASPYMMDILENLHPSNPDLSILLETNGVFFDEAHWERIKHLSDFRLEVTITINSFDEHTYRHISRGGIYKKMLHNLEFVSHLRKKGDIKFLTNTLVIQDRNFREIPSFIKRSFKDYAFDQVQLRPVYQWGTMDEDVFWFKDVLNPLHPYHEEYLEILRDPALRDPRVYNFGGETEHPARPYPSRAGGPFPCDAVKRGSRIVVYGAGQIGQAVVRQLKEGRGYTIVGWVDKCPDGECVKSPESIKELAADGYDVVLLATANAGFAQEMREVLLAMGVPAERIVSCAS